MAEDHNLDRWKRPVHSHECWNYKSTSLALAIASLEEVVLCGVFLYFSERLHLDSGGVVVGDLA